MLYAVCTSSRAAAAGHNKCERTFDQRHTVLLEWQQFMFRDRQIIQVLDKWTWEIDHDFFPVTPCQALDFMQVDITLLIDSWFV